MCRSFYRSPKPAGCTFEKTIWHLSEARKTFRQSLKEFVTMARKSRSLHQNYFHTNDLTKATPKPTEFAWRWFRLLMRFNLSILFRKIMQKLDQEYILGRVCSQGLVFRCEDCGYWVDLWLTFMLKLPSWLKSTVNKTRNLRRRALLLSLLVVAGKCKLLPQIRCNSLKWLTTIVPSKCCHFKDKR